MCIRDSLCAVQNAGHTLTINAGAFECQGADAVLYNSAITATVGSSTVINGGEFEGNGAGAVAVFGKLTVNGGTFNGAYGVCLLYTSRCV